MKFDKNEFTVRMLAEELSKRFKKEGKKKEFTVNDIEQYLLRGQLPYKYGGNLLEVRDTRGSLGLKTIIVKSPQENIKNAIEYEET